jgi:hypothetical protein
MSEWVVMSQTVTAGGHPREFAIGTLYTDGGTWIGPEYSRVWHVVAAERQGGPKDDVVPRRAMGIGEDRACARRSLEGIVSRHDPSGVVVYPRKRRV